MSSSSPSAARPRCERCLRPAQQCLCPLIPNLNSHTRLLIVQHPSERNHALNTARLLALGLQQAELLVAESLAEHPQWLAALKDPHWRTELLFPGPDVPLLSAQPEDSRPRRLVLLDGTWRKARKLMHVNPALQALPRVSLPASLRSRYRLRKVPHPGALSSIEAGVEALRILEPGLPVDQLLAPFDALIDAQINAMGPDLYARNYRTH